MSTHYNKISPGEVRRHRCSSVIQQRWQALAVAFALLTGWSGCGPSGTSGGDQGGDLGGDHGGDLGRADLATPDLAGGGMPPSGLLSVLAGLQTGPGSVDGTGAKALFDNPAGITGDGAGNLYVADSGNSTIRKIVAATGAVTTLAGTALMPGSADGTGAAARFNDPGGIAGDGAGNLYVTDGGTTIRRIAIATGAVTTLAGTAGMPGSTDGTGAAARFRGAVGIASDGAGNLYVADFGNQTIRKVVIATAVVTTLAGMAGMTGSADGAGAVARFFSPVGIASDGAGNLYVADQFNCTIRKVVIATAVVTTLAGRARGAGSADGTGAAALFFSPNGIANDGAGNLYVTDYTGDTIRKIVIATAVVTTLAGTPNVMPGITDGTGAAARFNRAFGVTSDGAGHLYVADAGNDTVREIVIATGVVTTPAGSDMAGSADGTGTAAQFNQPNGIASDGAGHLYVVDTGNSTIRKIVIATGAVTTLAGAAGATGSADGTGAAARFNQPNGIASDGAGHLYVTDTFNFTIRRIVIATGAVTTLAGTAGSAGSADGTGAAAQFLRTEGIASDGAGHLYVADSSSNTIREIGIATGVVTTLAGKAGEFGFVDGTGAAALFNFPKGVASDGAGNLYVADWGNNTVRKIVIASGAVTTLAGAALAGGSADGTGAAARFDLPLGIASDGAGNLYVTDDNNHAVRKIVIATAVVSTPIGGGSPYILKPGPLPASLGCPAYIAAVAGGLAFTDNCANVVLLASF